MPEKGEQRRLSPDKQAAEWQRCAEDIVYWVNTYCFTYDPREPNATLPFQLFARQAEFLLWLQCREHNQEDALAEKCRDVGFTWLCCVYALHGWLFRKGFAAGFGSRKLELVDKIGDMDSILEKIRFLIDHLPDWMRPAGYKPKLHAGFCKILNPANGSSITGEGGDQIGRGGRKTVYFVDEHAFLARAKKVEAALSQTSRCKIRVSTPNGTGNPFHTLRFGGKIPVFTFRWRDDPRKTEEWYRKQCEILDAVTVAQEIDIDYTASVEGICIPAKWVLAAVNLHQTERFKQAFPNFKVSGPVVSGLDVAAGGKNRNVQTFRQGIVIFDVLTWNHVSLSETAYKAADNAEKRKTSQLNYDGVGVGEGITDTFDTTERVFWFLPVAVMGGNPATEAKWPDGRTSRERYINLRAEIWMMMRARFEKAYEFLVLGKDHPWEELVSIPNNENLISQLSLPLMQRTNTDKTKVESKEDMKKRGVESPDFADSCAYTFTPQIGDWSDVEIDEASLAESASAGSPFLNEGTDRSGFESWDGPDDYDDYGESESATVAW